MRSIQKLGRMGRILLEYRARRTRLRSLPLRLWIESTSRCNLRCVMCPNKEVAADEKGVMDMALFRKIIDEAKGFASDVNLHHRGEPLLHPELFDMIRYANEAGLKTRFHSNGALLDEKKASRLLEAAPGLVSFSIDGFTKESYERVRVGATFERTVENVLRLAAMRRESGRKRPYIVVEKIRFRSGAESADPAEVAALRCRFLAAGVDEVIEKEEYEWTTALSQERVDRRAFSVCTFPWYAMVICFDGTVTPCPQDFHAGMNLGNVSSSSLREIWNGDGYQDLRRRFTADVNSLELCRKCDRLCRRTMGGIPVQYLATFLVDQVLGYGRIRRFFGTHERNGGTP